MSKWHKKLLRTDFVFDLLLISLDNVIFLCVTQDELCGIVDVPDPDHMNGAARREARQLAEQQKFDEDHYV